MIQSDVIETLRFSDSADLAGKYLFVLLLGQFLGHNREEWSNVDPNEFNLTFRGFYNSVSFFMKIDQEMRL